MEHGISRVCNMLLKIITDKGSNLQYAFLHKCSFSKLLSPVSLSLKQYCLDH